MRNLTKIELDTLRWVRDADGILFTNRRRKTFQKLVELGLVSSFYVGPWGQNRNFKYVLSQNGEMVLSSYDGPRRVVSKG